MSRDRMHRNGHRHQDAPARTEAQDTDSSGWPGKRALVERRPPPGAQALASHARDSIELIVRGLDRHLEQVGLLRAQGNHVAATARLEEAPGLSPPRAGRA